MPTTRGGWLAISHELILDRDVPDAALWLWLCLLDVDSTPDTWVGCSQDELAAHAGWTTGLVPGSGGRRVRHQLRPLEARGWIRSRKRPWRGYSFLTQHQVCRRPDQGNAEVAWEKVPRLVFDRLRQDPALRRSAPGLLRHWLLWRSDAGRYGFTQQTLAGFAHDHHIHRSIVTKRFHALAELGLLLVHTDGELLTVRFPAMPGSRPQLVSTTPAAHHQDQILPADAQPTPPGPDTTEQDAGAGQDAGNNVLPPHAPVVEETSAEDLKNCPTVFSPPVHTDVNTQSGPGSQQTSTSADQAAGKPPTINHSAPHTPTKPKKRRKRRRDQAAVWAGRTIARSPQTSQLDPRTRGRLRQFLARAWRQQPGRDLEQASRELIGELQLAEDLGLLHSNHVVVMRQVTTRWWADRLVAPEPEPEILIIPPRPSGPNLQDLAYTPVGQARHAADDATLRAQELTVELAGKVLDVLAAGECDDVDDALRRTRHTMPVTGDERALLAVAAAKVRTAYQVSCYEVQYDDHPDEQLLDLARQSLADAAARAA